MKLSIKAMIAISVMLLIVSVCFAGDKVPTHQSIDWNRYEYEEFLLWVKFTPPMDDPKEAHILIMTKILEVKTPKKYTPRDLTNILVYYANGDDSKLSMSVNYYVFKPGGNKTGTEKHAYELIETWRNDNNLYTAVRWLAYLDDKANITRVVPQIVQIQLGQDGAAVSSPEESWEFIKMTIDEN